MNHRSVQIIRRGNNTVVFSVGDRIELSLSRLQEAGLCVSNSFSKSNENVDIYVRGVILGFDEECGVFGWASVISFVFALDLPLKNRQLSAKEISWAQDYRLSTWQVFIIPQRTVSSPRLMRKSSYNIFEANSLFLCQLHGCGKIHQKQDILRFDSDLADEAFHCCKTHFVPWDDKKHTVDIRHTTVLFTRVNEAALQMGLIVDNMDIKCLFYTGRYVKSSSELKMNTIQDILFVGSIATVSFEIEARQRRTFRLSWTDLANQVFMNKPVSLSPDAVIAIEGEQESFEAPTIIDGYVDSSHVFETQVMNEDGDAEEVKFPSPCVVCLRSAATSNSYDQQAPADPIEMQAGASFHRLALAASVTVPTRWNWKVDDMLFFLEGQQPFPYGNRELHYRMPLTARTFDEAKNEVMCHYSRSVRDLNEGFVVLDMHSIQDAVLPPVQLDCLSGEFRHNPSMVQKVQVMETVYGGYRKIRGDGNCYHRAVIFGVVEQALQEPFRQEKLASLHRRFISSCSVDSDDIKFFLDRLEAAASGVIWHQVADFEQELCNPESRLDIGMVMATKELLGRYIIQHEDDLVQGMTLREAIMAIFSDMSSLEEYVQEYVVKLDVSAEGPFVFLGLLYKALQCHGITIMLDRRAEVPLNLVETDPFEGLMEATQEGQEDADEKGEELKVIASVHLLLRPGHYDLMYPLQSCAGLLQPKVAGAMLESIFGIERQALANAAAAAKQQQQQQQMLLVNEGLSTASASAAASYAVAANANADPESNDQQSQQMIVEEDNPFANHQDQESLDGMKNLLSSQDVFISPENTFMLVDAPSFESLQAEENDVVGEQDQQQQQQDLVDHSDIAVVMMDDTVASEAQEQQEQQQEEVVVVKKSSYELMKESVLQQQAKIRAERIIIEEFVPSAKPVMSTRVILVSGLPNTVNNKTAVVRSVALAQDQSVHQTLATACSDSIQLKKVFAHCSYASYDGNVNDLLVHVHSLFRVLANVKVELLHVNNMTLLSREAQHELFEDSIIEVIIPNIIALELSVPQSTLFSPKVNNDAVQIAPAGRGQAKKSMSYSSASASALMDVDDEDFEEIEKMQRYLVHIDMTQIKSIDHLIELISYDLKVKQPSKLVSMTNKNASLTLLDLAGHDRMSLYQGKIGQFQLIEKEQYFTLTVTFFHEQQTVQIKESSSLVEIIIGLGKVFHIPMPGYPVKLFYGVQPITDEHDKQMLLPLAASSKQALTLTGCVMCFRNSFRRPAESANYRQELLSVTDSDANACEHMICRDCLESYLKTQTTTRLYKVPADRMQDAIPEAVPIKAPCCSEYCYLSSYTIVVTDKASSDFTFIANEMHALDMEDSRKRVCRLQVICRDDEPEEIANMYQLGCGHFFHLDCIGAQMKHSLDQSRQERQDIRCSFCIKIAYCCTCPTCYAFAYDDSAMDLSADNMLFVNPHRVTYEEMKYLLPKVNHAFNSQEEQEKYLNWFQENMLKGSGMMVSVIECRCSFIFEAPGHTEGECPKCHFNMCFHCKLAVHPGLACGEVPEVKDDDCQYPQRCPGCEQIYEYWRDCLHMTCVKVDCKQQFCFLCAAPHLPSLHHGASYHRPKCALYQDCCGKNCVKNGRKSCETDKYLPGPCAACKGKANKHNLCTHSEWRPCSTCRAGNTPCSHWCNECEAAGHLCTRPTNMRRLKGQEVEARFYTREQMAEVEKQATAKDKKGGEGKSGHK